MKSAIAGIVATIIVVTTFLMVSSIQSNTNKTEEVDTALNDALYATQQDWMNEDMDEEQYLDAFRNNLDLQLASGKDVSYSMEVYGIDAEKGLLDIGLTCKYTNSKNDEKEIYKRKSTIVDGTQINNAASGGSSGNDADNDENFVSYTAEKISYLGGNPYVAFYGTIKFKKTGKTVEIEFPDAWGDIGFNYKIVLDTFVMPPKYRPYRDIVIPTDIAGTKGTISISMTGIITLDIKDEAIYGFSYSGSYQIE